MSKAGLQAFICVLGFNLILGEGGQVRRFSFCVTNMLPAASSTVNQDSAACFCLLAYAALLLFTRKEDKWVSMDH